MNLEQVQYLGIQIRHPVSFLTVSATLLYFTWFLLSCQILVVVPGWCTLVMWRLSDPIVSAPYLYVQYRATKVSIYVFLKRRSKVSEKTWKKSRVLSALSTLTFAYRSDKLQYLERRERTSVSAGFHAMWNLELLVLVGCLENPNSE